MNEVRRQLGRGLPPERAAALQTEVRRAVESLRQQCQARGISPLDLPGPSRKAYEYLKSLEFPATAVTPDPEPRNAELPASGPGLAPRLVGWIRHKEDVQRQLAAIARARGSLSDDKARARIDQLRAELLESAGKVAEWCERAGSSPAALPSQARRAFQWMSYLAEPGHLEQHVEALAVALAVDPRVEVEFYHLAALYRVTRQAERVRLVASEAFVGAPSDILRALVKVALPRTRKALYRAQIEEYAESAPFRETLLELEAFGGDSADGRGLIHDLEQVFDRVNARHFAGTVPRPRLRWSKTVTGREFGHYQQSTDTLVLSLRLDSPDVPDFVIDHVMHHELLHKVLGTERVDGRRRAHTAEFRRQERKFRRFEEADRFLRGLCSGRERGRQPRA